MSLRPTFSGFSLSRLRDLLAKGDPSLGPALDARLAKAARDPASLERARVLAEQLLTGTLRVDVENEQVLRLVVFAAQAQQSLFTDSGIFWESFCVAVDGAGGELPGGPTALLRYFLDGRPLIGSRIQSSWALYAYLDRSEAAELFAFVRSFPPFQIEYGFEESMRWASEVEARGLDLFFVAS